MAEKKINYLVNPGYAENERIANYTESERLNKIWRPMKKLEVKRTGGNSGNLSINMVIDRQTLTCRLLTKEDDRMDQFKKNGSFVGMAEAIGSHTLLYRLICMFPNPYMVIYGSRGYKVPYEFFLKHIPTDEFVVFREWKGASGFGSPFYDWNDVPEDYKNDLFALINLLLSNTSPHPYDGLVAGEVA